MLRTVTIGCLLLKLDIKVKLLLHCPIPLATIKAGIWSEMSN